MKTMFFLVLSAALFLSSCVPPIPVDGNPGNDMLSVPFTFSKSGHMIITAEINGKKTTMLIDTGASLSIIHIGKLEYLGLESTEKKGKASGIGTSNYDMKKVMVTEMILNSVSYPNPEFNGLDLFHIERIDYQQTLDGIIGGDFLKKHDAVIDYSRQTLFLRKP
jgi:predicted aspartyl protease